jgi:hypothetical protein
MAQTDSNSGYVFEIKPKISTWNDWTGDSDSSAVVDKLLEGRSFEEELSDDEIGPGVTFVFKHQLQKNDLQNLYEKYC